MKRTLLLLTLLSLSTSGTAFASNPDVKRAKDAFRNSKFGTAASLYGQLAQRYPRQADLWYNLGTAEARAQRLGRASFAFEQCLALDSGHGDAEHNLDQVRKRVMEKALQTSKTQTLVLPGNDDVGTGLLAAIPLDAIQLIFALSWPLLFLMLYGLKRWPQSNGRTAASFTAILIGLTAVCAGGLLLTRNYVVDQSQYGVVIEESSARRGPGKQYGLQTRVADGVKVRLGGRDREWRQVILPNGQGSWMAKDSISVIRR